MILLVFKLIAGFVVDGDDQKNVIIIKQVGKVAGFLADFSINKTS